MIAFSNRTILVLGVVLSLLSLGILPVAAREVIREWPPLLDPDDVVPGMRGIVENRGKHVHNVGNVFLNVTNFGIVGSMPGSRQRFENAPSAQWPAGSGIEYLWGGGLWVGARRFGEVAVSAWEVQDGRLFLEFFPGLSDLERIYETKELSPGGARLPASNADDDGDGRTDEERLDGRDNDGDGLIDEDFAAISDQMFYCEYRDDDSRLRAQSPEHRPLGIRVQQTSMAWGVDQLQDTIVFEFTLINESSTPLTSVYPGFFADFDIGPRENSAAGNDDLAGFWMGRRLITIDGRPRLVELEIGYMFDADGDEGLAPGYVGLMFLGAPVRRAVQGRPTSIPMPFPTLQPLRLHNFQMYTRVPSRTTGGRPSNDEERYALLSGTAPNALGPREAPDNLRRSVLATQPNDYSIVISTGPSSLGPGGALTVRLAMVFGDGFEDMVQNAMEIRRIHDGAWLDLNENPWDVKDGKELPACGPQYAGYLVPSVPCSTECVRDPSCWIKIPEEGCEWFDADCDPFTGIDGRETFVPWVSRVPPTAPKMRLVAREGRVEVMWDNRSERLPDPFLLVSDFESYRIWRADNWTRPLGTNPRTGPGNNLWFLMDEYDLAGNGIGNDTGLDAVRYDPSVPPVAVEFYREWFRQHPTLAPPELPGLTPGQIDSAQALGRGVRYYRYVDPSFVPGGAVAGPCPETGECPPIQTGHGPVPARCNAEGRCAETLARPQPGTHVFYAVTATDHELKMRLDGTLVATGPGVAGLPNSNFEYIVPPTDALPPEEFARAKEHIYVVPNPATRHAMAEWALKPNNDDPSGVKIEFHNLPQSTGRISIYTVAADLVIVIPFDGREGNGTASWDLISRNGQDIASGVYLYVVEATASGFEKFVDRFVVVR